MNQETRKALNASIAHWERMRDGSTEVSDMVLLISEILLQDNP